MFIVPKNFLHKNLAAVILFFSLNLFSEDNPYIFIDKGAQEMVNVLKNNKELFSENRDEFEKKIKDIFEPMIDFRYVTAMVMGKNYYKISTKKQRLEFQEVFKDSLLDTYAETLSQWDDQRIITEIPELVEVDKKIIEVRVALQTENSLYPINFKLRWNNESWKIVNIIINGVNLGLTFRNQFKTLAIESSNEIDSIIIKWKSDVGNAGIE